MKKILVVGFGEALFVLFGVMIVLGVAAGGMKFFAPIRSEHYAYFCIGGAIVGFSAWIIIAALFFRHRDLSCLISASIAIFSLSLAFQVIVPMTIERSITVFLLNEMAKEPLQGYSAEELQQKLLQNYVEKRHVLEKRLKENKLSGTLSETFGKYRLSSSGLRIAHTLTLIGQFFSVPDESFSQNALPDQGLTR